MEITRRQIEQAYTVASQVFDGRLAVEAGARLLHGRDGLNINSARDFINDYRKMLHGKVFHRAMSAIAIDYFLTRMAEERGVRSVIFAIDAVQKHITYYEGLRKVTLHSLRSVLEQHCARIAAPPSLSEQEAAFELSLGEAYADSQSQRRERLAGATKMPLKLKVITEVYLRNADVVAEVLHRATGACERCRQPAPFIRKRDGTPYLEVHHIQTLAEGGEDTVENAIALCPNCHRELHYGSV
ncbi:MAG TPA: HNH endonuclease [Longimicrobium sp.]|jgi:5-methylcytosine-specific restriction protein A|nr:HNH endonuclease [Longimicrobium sp.]